MKKFTSIAIILLMVFSMNVISIMSVGAVDLSFEDFTYTLNENNEATIVGYTGEDITISVPATIDGNKVVAIGKKAFNYNTEISNIILPNTITSIDSEAFEGCNNLATIDLSATKVTEIKYQTFKGCSSLLMIAFPERLTAIGEEAFKDCKALEYSEKLGNSFNIPSTVMTIEKGAFENGGAFKSITIPEEITEISAILFSGCNNLETVIIEGNATKIGNHAFSSCKALKNIVLPDTVTEIGACAFTYCEELEYIKIPKETTIIGDQAFAGCRKLSAVDFNDKLKTIDKFAFSGCISLKTVVIPKSVSTINEYAFGESLGSMNLERITILNPNCTIYQSQGTIYKDATIVCYENSFAHLYAEKYNMNYELIGETPEENVLGDVNGDGEVTVMDATLVQRNVAKLTEFTETQKTAGDTNKDGEISVIDATMIQRFVAKLIEEF